MCKIWCSTSRNLTGYRYASFSVPDIIALTSLHPPSSQPPPSTLHPHTITPSHSKDYGIWERGDKINHGETELNATSIGMAKVRRGEGCSPKWGIMKYWTCAVHIEGCEGWWLAGGHGSVHWQLKPEMSWVCSLVPKLHIFEERALE